MEKKYRDMCIVLIFSVCSVLVLSGLIITNYFMNGRLLAKVDCACTKCVVKDNGGNVDNNYELITQDELVKLIDEQLYIFYGKKSLNDITNQNKLSLALH